MNWVLAVESKPRADFAELEVELWHWGALLGILITLLLIDLLVVHKQAHEIGTKQAALESAVWITCGLTFAVVVWW
jgi:tellurite resistance protein TerC